MIATGGNHSVRELAETAFGLVVLDWRQYVVVDDAYFRPADVEDQRGDPSKARRRLGWIARTTCEDLIREMLEHDISAEGLDPTKHLDGRAIVVPRSRTQQEPLSD